MLVHRRGFLRGVAATAVGSLCRPAIAQGGARPLRFVPHAPLTVLDPVWATAFVSRNHGYMVYDTLYGLGGDLQPRPQMAEGHLVEDDGLAWTITLRPGLRFHDGEPVRAADCAASLRRWGGRDTLGQTLFALTDELLVLDDRRLRFRLRRPFPLLPRALAKATPSVPFIMPERVAATDPTQQVREVIGSGPYRFVESEWQPGARAVYARFDGYEPRQEAADMLAGGKRALVGRVEWTPMPDPATAAAALQTGEVDWWEQAAADLVPALRRRRGIAIDRLDPFGNLAILRVNHLHPPFDDAAARRALLPAIVQSDFVQAVVGQDRALWRDEVGFFTPDTPSASVASMDALSSTRDAGAARRGLEAAGRLGARAVLLAATDIPPLAALSQVAGDLFRRVGLDLDYVASDWGSVVQRRANRGSVAQGGWSAFCSASGGLDFADPAAHFALRGNGTDAWIGWPTSPRLEEMRNAWIATDDPVTARRIASAMQAQAFRDVPYYPLGAFYLPAAWRGDRLANMPQGPVPFAWGISRSG